MHMKNSRKFLKTASFVAALFIVIAITAKIGFYIGSQTGVMNDEQAMLANNAGIKVGWKMYRNQDYGFEFQYPVGWQVIDNSYSFHALPHIKVEIHGPVVREIPNRKGEMIDEQYVFKFDESDFGK